MFSHGPLSGARGPRPRAPLDPLLCIRTQMTDGDSIDMICPKSNQPKSRLLGLRQHNPLKFNELIGSVRCVV